MTLPSVEAVPHSMAKLGKCDNGCYNMVAFLIIVFVFVFVTSCGQNPALMITLKSVDKTERSFALGLQNFLGRLIGKECRSKFDRIDQT